MSAERVIVEGLDGNGRVEWRQRVELNAGRAFTIGRSLEADVTLDDPHAAALHASVEVADDGRLFATDLGSLNGLVVGGKPWRNAQSLELPDSTLQVGRTRLRVRTAHERLDPERPYAMPTSPLERRPAWIAGIAALATAAQVVYACWLGAPRDLAISIVTSMSLAAAVAAGWVAIWGLLSRVMQGRWSWLRHFGIFLGVSAVFVAVNGLADLAGFLFAVPPSSGRYTWIGAVALASMLFLHLRHASNLQASRAALIACTIPLLLAGAAHWIEERSRTRDVNYIGARMRIYPPALMLRAPNTLEDFFNRAPDLREFADKRLAEAVANEPGTDAEE
ncbi:MAG: FHA domain-containing protein [Hyphomicrobiaceae bacterium]|nr:FHA domain-containing protein [Hyphomicrobiaceae bacterium]